jgi:hypothetical protein
MILAAMRADSLFARDGDKSVAEAPLAAPTTAAVLEGLEPRELCAGGSTRNRAGGPRRCRRNRMQVVILTGGAECGGYVGGNLRGVLWLNRMMVVRLARFRPMYPSDRRVLGIVVAVGVGVAVALVVVSGRSPESRSDDHRAGEDHCSPPLFSRSVLLLLFS